MDAAGQFNKVLEKDPDHFDAWIGLGNCEREIGNELYSNATVTVQARGARPEELKLAQTEADRAHKHHSQSRGCFERALELRPRNTQALYGLGQLYLSRASGGFRLFTEDEQGDVDRHFVAAEKCFAMVVGAEPASYPAHFRLGLARLGMGDRALAKPSLELYLKRLREMEKQTAALKPENDEDRAVVQHQLMILRKDIADTETLIEQCGTPVPASSLEPIHALARTLQERRRHAEAIKPLERCLTRAQALKAEWTAWKPADDKGRKLRAEELGALEERIETLQGELAASREAAP